jgi:hypothetical protein
MRTRRVPRATRRPRGREEVLPSSSVLGLVLAACFIEEGCRCEEEMVTEGCSVRDERGRV